MAAVFLDNRVDRSGLRDCGHAAGRPEDLARTTGPVRITLLASVSDWWERVAFPRGVPEGAE